MSEKQVTIVVGVVRNEAGDVLLARRHQPEAPESHGKWEFVGGGVDFGENPLDALRREVREEAGIEIENIRLLPTVLSDIQKFSDGNTYQVIILSYECKIASGTIGGSEEEEIAELKFVPLEKVKNYNTFKNIQQTVEMLKK